MALLHSFQLRNGWFAALNNRLSSSVDVVALLRSPVFIVGLMTLPVGLFAILRGALTAKYFGADWTVDAYMAAQALALFLVSVAGNTLAAISVPEAARAYATLDRQQANCLAYAMLCIGVLKFFALSLLIVLSAPLYVGAVGVHFDPATRQLCTDLVYIFALFFLLSATSAQVSALLNFTGHYAAPALSQALIPGVACISLTAFQADRGIESLAWGVVIGAALQCVFLTSMLFRRLGFPQFKLSRVNMSYGRLGKEYCLLAFAAALMGAAPFIDLQMAAKLGTGSVASLAFGGLIPMLAAGFLAGAVAGPALSKFSQQVAYRNFKGAARSLNFYIGLCVALTALPTLLLIGLTPMLVDLLFVHGGAALVDRETINQVQSLLLVQIPFYAASIIAVRMLTALELGRLITVVALANLALRIALNMLFSQSLGVAGIALSTSVVYVFSLCCCWYLAVSSLSRRCTTVAKLASA